MGEWGGGEWLSDVDKACTYALLLAESFLDLIAACPEPLASNRLTKRFSCLQSPKSTYYPDNLSDLLLPYTAAPQRQVALPPCDFPVPPLPIHHGGHREIRLQRHCRG